jgi:hypothetical protein
MDQLLSVCSVRESAVRSVRAKATSKRRRLDLDSAKGFATGGRNQEQNHRRQQSTTESNIRRKARRRGYRVGKYRQGWHDVYAATHWLHACADIWDASLEELEEFINKQPLEEAR